MLYVLDDNTINNEEFLILFSEYKNSFFLNFTNDFIDIFKIAELTFSICHLIFMWSYVQVLRKHDR